MCSCVTFLALHQFCLNNLYYKINIYVLSDYPSYFPIQENNQNLYIYFCELLL